jgi:N-acyl-L-homoserine lactone synthetase
VNGLGDSAGRGLEAFVLKTKRRIGVRKVVTLYDSRMYKLLKIMTWIFKSFKARRVV